MKKSLSALALLMALAFMSACSHYETYAEKKDKENKAIRQFINERGINVISEATFNSQGRTTDVSKNEYVLLSASGVYMQIVRQGCGSQIKDGETCTVLCRFTERNLLTDTVQLSNDILYYATYVDKMNVTRTSDQFSASFIAGQSVMYTEYGQSVPPGWLAPLLYINVGRPEKEGDEIAKVNIIVPSAQGTQTANGSVYPCHYIITYEKGL